ELARGGGVATALIVLAYVPDDLDLAPDQPVHETRLPHSRCADERDRAIRTCPTPELFETFAGDRTRDDHVEIGRRGMCKRDAGFNVIGIDEVGFRQHDNRRRATLEREDELPL